MSHVFHEHDGSLGVIEFTSIFFTPRRLFWLFGISPDAIRAAHAHRTSHQLLICLTGSLVADVTIKGSEATSHSMTAGSTLHLEPLQWLELRNFSHDAVLAVLASEHYDAAEYINSWDELHEIWGIGYKD